MRKSGAALPLIKALDARYDRKRQITFNAVVESVTRDNDGGIIGARATIDGTPGVPIQVGYGSNVAKGSKLMAVNYGTLTAPNWIALGAAGGVGAPRMVNVYESDTSIGDQQYNAGDAIFGDVRGRNVNLLYDASDGSMRFRYGHKTLLLLDPYTLAYFPFNDGRGRKARERTPAFLTGHLSGEFSWFMADPKHEYLWLRANAGNYYRDSGGVYAYDPQRRVTWSGDAGEVLAIRAYWQPIGGTEFLMFADDDVSLIVRVTGGIFRFSYWNGSAYETWETSASVIPAMDEMYALSFRFTFGTRDATSPRLRVTRLSTRTGVTYVTGSGAAWVSGSGAGYASPMSAEFYIGRLDFTGTTPSYYTTGLIQRLKIMTALSDAQMDAFGL